MRSSQKQISWLKNRIKNLLSPSKSHDALFLTPNRCCACVCVCRCAAQRDKPFLKRGTSQFSADALSDRTRNPRTLPGVSERLSKPVRGRRLSVILAHWRGGSESHCLSRPRLFYLLPCNMIQNCNAAGKFSPNWLAATLTTSFYH